MLTPKQARFVDEYLKDVNASQAAIRAGYSAKTANQQGPRLLENPEIQAAIDAAKLARADRTQVDADFVLARLVEEANADIKDVFGPKGDLLPVDQWPEIFRTGLVQSVDSESIKLDGVEIGKVRKIRFKDRTRILELIGKHIRVNAFQEQVHHTGLDTLGDRLERAKKRMESERRVIDMTPAAKAIAAPVEQPPQFLIAAAPFEQTPAAAKKPTAPPAQIATPPNPDWQYQPILPAKQAFADTDYEASEDGFFAAYRND